MIYAHHDHHWPIGLQARTTQAIIATFQREWLYMLVVFLCLPVCVEGTAARGGCLSDPERLGSGLAARLRQEWGRLKDCHSRPNNVPALLTRIALGMYFIQPQRKGCGNLPAPTEILQR
jgi:hypothetical protein